MKWTGNEKHQIMQLVITGLFLKVLEYDENSLMANIY